MNEFLSLPIKINEIFFSIQGESTLVGLPTVFVRTTGCNIRCTYCDTKYSYFEGEKTDLGSVLEKIKTYKTKNVCVTGGEPMAQKHIHEFLKLLCDEGYTTSLETSGYFDCGKVDPRVIKVIDVKTPGSGEGDSFNFENLKCLNAQDQAKFVICNEKDYDWAKNFILEHRLADKCTVLMSPAFETMSNKMLAEKILNDFLPVRLQLQLHKYIWSPLTRGV